MTKFTYIFLILSVLTATGLDSTVVAATGTFPEKIHFLGDNYACGKMQSGSVECVDWNLQKKKTFDTLTQISSPQDIFVNRYAVCANDSEGFKCFFENDSLSIRRLAASIRPGTMSLGHSSACGIEPSGALYCKVPDWYRTSRKEFRHLPIHSIGKVAYAYDQICWIDGDAISCRSDDAPFKRFEMKGATDIAATRYPCARSATEAKCWVENSELILSVDFLKAKMWSSDEGSTLCALTDDERFVCLDWNTGGVDVSGRFAFPTQFSTAGSGLIQIDNSNGYSYCGVIRHTDEVKCWDTYASQLEATKFSDEVIAFRYSPYGICATLKSGEFECRSPDGFAPRILERAGETKGMFGKDYGCHFNESGISCLLAPSLESLTSVSDFQSDEDLEYFCAIGSKPGAPKGVHCEGDKISRVPNLLPNASSVSVSSAKACAIESGSLHCWGDEYSGEARPSSFSNLKRVVLGSKHACGIDDFGLVCWGEVASRNLTVPSDLASPGVVTDVALGLNRTCALLTDQTVRCWGDVDADNEPLPVLTGVTELIGSRQHAFCAKNASGYHCWGAHTSFPK